MEFNKQEIYFSTLTIDKWTAIFHDFPETISFCFDAFNYLTKEKFVTIYSFVIMRDHLHIIWEAKNNYVIQEIITKFKQFVGTKIVNFLQEFDTDYLSYFTTERKDRKHKIWKIAIGNIRIQHKDIYEQKIRYIHNNPCVGKYKVVEQPEDYFFSSAKAYAQGFSNFKFLSLHSTIL